MANPPFDASKAVTFDLSRGQIQKEDNETRLLVSARALAALCRGAGAEATSAFGRAIGDSIGAAIATRFERAGSTAKSASTESVVEHLAGELALAGFGTLAAERWGRALVLVVDHAPERTDGDNLIEPLLAAALSKSTSVEVKCVRLTREGDRARFLVTGAKGANKVRDWLKEGVSWGEVLVRLHPPATTAGEA